MAINHTEITVGGHILLTCMSEGMTVWTFREPLDGIPHRLHNSTEFVSLQLGPISFRHYGRYICAGINRIGTPFMESVMLKVYGMILNNLLSFYWHLFIGFIYF